MSSALMRGLFSKVAITTLSALPVPSESNKSLPLFVLYKKRSLLSVGVAPKINCSALTFPGVKPPSKPAADTKILSCSGWKSVIISSP